MTDKKKILGKRTEGKMKNVMKKVMAKENKNSLGKMFTNMEKIRRVKGIFGRYRVKGKYRRFPVRRELKCFVWE